MVETVELDLGSGLLALLTREDATFREWAKQVHLDDLLARLKVAPKAGTSDG